MSATAIQKNITQHRHSGCLHGREWVAGDRAAMEGFCLFVFCGNFAVFNFCECT